MMYNLTDGASRELCLAPEYTAVIQKLSNTYFKTQNDIKVFYIAECFRGEKPQKGRYRQFTQLGVEIINPTLLPSLENTAMELCFLFSKSYEYTLNINAKRGLDYYKNGFEISCDDLGSSKQICGGGIGFVIGVDRLLE